uniref:Uncharacterized protein n=1 Tax=uncultured organism MedDCM-OCT-S08-C998 TaxID=743643 RepID=D6PJC4_9ZZZZ|nr:hypothetical protein [uncultured organism MedDCM-OCT-S08-C998]
MEETVGAESASYAQVHGEYGECLRQLGNHIEAESVLQRAIVLCRTAFAGEDGKAEGKSRHVHSSVALFQMYRAQVLLDEGKPDEALEVLEGEVYPPLRGMLGTRHPLVLFSKGLCALCLQRSKTPRSERSHLSAELLEEQPQDIIDEVLEALDTHDSGKSPLSDSHPWVLALGGYLLDTARSSRGNTARNASARLSARDSARSRSVRGLEASADDSDSVGTGHIDPEIVPWDALARG